MDRQNRNYFILTVAALLQIMQQLLFTRVHVTSISHEEFAEQADFISLSHAHQDPFIHF